MTEREMQELLWNHPDKLLNEPLAKFRWEPQSQVGRADLVFKDRRDRLLVVEVKRGKLGRGVIDQLLDYFGMMKREFPDKPVELMVVANSIPEERRLSCDQYNIEWREISEKKFRDVAGEIGYAFASEKHDTERIVTKDRPQTSPKTRGAAMRTGNKVEKAWCYWVHTDGRGYFLAFVNAKGNCSMRRFDAESGAFLGRQYASGDYQEAFREYIMSGTLIGVSHQPNLEKHCKERLPSPVLAELRRQIPRKQVG